MKLSILALALGAAAGSLTRIGGYVPETDVTEHNRMDLDQRAIETFLGKPDFADALAVYDGGAHSTKYAVIKVLDPAAEMKITKGTLIYQGTTAAPFTADGTGLAVIGEVLGKSAADGKAAFPTTTSPACGSAASGSTAAVPCTTITLPVQAGTNTATYTSTEIAIKYTPASGANCAEGALTGTAPVTTNAATTAATTKKDSGCFAVRAGKMDIHVGNGRSGNTEKLVLCGTGECTATTALSSADPVYTKKRNMKAFSTDALSKMGPSGLNEPMFNMYNAYFGSDTYANDIVYSMKGEACTSTASGTPTRTCIKDFCKDFFCEVDANGAVTQYPQSTTVRKEIIKKSSAYITTWMYVLHEYRDAVGDCENDSLTDNNASVHATDEAMAFYTGELEGQTGFNYARDNAGDLINKVGYLIHNLADKRCANFGTCTGKPENTNPDPDNTKGASAVNTKVAELAQQFAAEVTSRACSTAADTLKLIEAQMTVPLVQGTIRYAYKCHKTDASLKSMAEGAVFWMSIAPQVAACNPTGAAVIQAAMLRPMTNANEGPYAGGASKFQEIMGVLQGCYSSMGITCADVGGLIDPLDSTGYATCVDPAPPAPATSTVKETTNDMPEFVLPAIIVLALLLAVFLGFCVHARAQANHFKVMYDQFAQAGGKATPGRRV